MSKPVSLVAGNWKMNGQRGSWKEIDSLITKIDKEAPADCEVLICPPLTLMALFAVDASQSKVQIGAQDCHQNNKGAHTGDVSASMIADCGGSHIIVGHSERRADHQETSALVHDKAVSVVENGMKAIICVGETEAERDAGDAVKIVLDQISQSVPSTATSETVIIAYEPVWAIGTGRTPTVADVEEIHTAIRNSLIDRFSSDGAGFSILYGGSVKPSNAKELMGAENVNGALVGGASLKADDFNGIIDAYRP
ncbi:triose-phosphate isomerase [Temperatibacter marinus]|uniref:Triosephosphate isomerase n=1 Tax=Temperatibacter marinus TaxID=1456591 RepID=A0AA52EHX3_9PROT|nr:triose-phosphate isomerase [Temperatibacter marinus]WND02366.1 triose-phosphate isomerase [Temperatibacter marinus]